MKKMLGAFAMLAALSCRNELAPVSDQPAKDTTLSLTGRIAFISDRSGAAQLYVMNADGSAIRRVTLDSYDYATPAWSMDGKKIALVSDGIYVINADGTGLLQVAPDGTDPAWSPDDTKIRFSRVLSDTTEIDEVTADGSTTTVLSRAQFGDRVAWSPDRTDAAFSWTRDPDDGPWQVYVAHLDGSGMRRLTSANDVPNGVGASCEGAPAWSPDGKRIAFWSQVFGISIMNADGTGKLSPRFRDDGVDGDTRLAWSPDGNSIAFSIFLQGSREIFVVNTAGTFVDRHLGVQGWDPAWSP